MSYEVLKPKKAEESTDVEEGRQCLGSQSSDGVMRYPQG